MEGTDSRPWDDLLPDALGLVFKNLSLQERFTVIPVVCKSWGKAVRGPYCWQEIDIDDWSLGCDPAKVDKMLRLLITRSSGSLQKLCVSGLKLERCFDFIAEHAHSLQTLKLPRCEMNDLFMEQVAAKLSTLTVLDLNYCSKMGAGALKAIGKNCKSLAKLSRNMHPIDMERNVSQNDEAHAIATTMPKLKHLEIAYNLVDTSSVLEIITNCSELELLDLRGCWFVDLDEKYLKEKFPKLTVLGPQVVDCYESWESCSDSTDSFYDYDSSETWDDVDSLETWDDVDSSGTWDDDDDVNPEMWDEDYRFDLGTYEDYVEGSDSDWPPSP